MANRIEIKKNDENEKDYHGDNAHDGNGHNSIRSETS